MRIQIFIDGGNFFHLALKPLGIQPTEFNFDAFANFLAHERTISDLGKRYYIGTVREREGDWKSKWAMSQQVKLFNILKKTAWQIKTSKLRERVEVIPVDRRMVCFEILKNQGIGQIVWNTFREKGIDVKIATDLVAGALDNKFDTAILVSSDTDLIPMIDWIRFRLKKKVEYVGFSIQGPSSVKIATQPTRTLIRSSDSAQILKEDDMRRFRTRND